MVSTAALGKVVRTLCEAHGRTPAKETFDAYSLALEPYNDTEVESGLINALREQREFMPPPGIVAGFAKDVRNARLRASRAPDERRLVCAICQDRGNVLIVNRTWLLEHRDKFRAEWFVAGWMREAQIWCLAHIPTAGASNGRKALIWSACCFCESPNAKTYREQALKYVDAVRRHEFDEKKIPRPAFGFQYKRETDCLIYSVDSSEVQAAVLEWAEHDNEGRTWSGNWNP